MKIRRITKQENYFVIETNNKIYIRYGTNSWCWLENYRHYVIFDCSGLEKVYQEFIEAQNKENL